MKDNQETLHNAIKDTFRSVAADGWHDVQHTHTRTVERGHGRIETRDYWVVTEPSYLAYLDPKHVWCTMCGSGMVVSERVQDGHTSHERH